MDGVRSDDEHERVRAGRLHGGDDPVDEAASEQRVQVLRRRGLHPRAEAGGHDHCGEVRHKAGAPGFEPGVAGPKPAALPLVYAPSTSTPKVLQSISSCRWTAVARHSHATLMAAPQAAPWHLATPHHSGEEIRC